MITFKVDRASFEDENDGFCNFVVRDDSEGNWVEIHGNEDEASYPLCFSNKEDVDRFADKIKSFLKD